MSTIKQNKNTGTTNENEGYPLYPASEDIYNNGQIDPEIDPEDIKKSKTPMVLEGDDNPRELNFDNGRIADDLDVPGAELDDEDELIGEEDEENNSYSLGGDEHNDLDEERE